MLSDSSYCEFCEKYFQHGPKLFPPMNVLQIAYEILTCRNLELSLSQEVLQ